MDYQTVFGGPDKQVPPGEWIIKRGAADVRRGTLVVPAEPEWMIQPHAADATSASRRLVSSRSYHIRRLHPPAS